MALLSCHTKRNSVCIAALATACMPPADPTSLSSTAQLQPSSLLLTLLVHFNSLQPPFVCCSCNITCVSCRIAAQSRVAAIGVELEQQESSLRQQLQAHQASSATEMSKLKAEVARLMHELDISMSQASCRSTQLLPHVCSAYVQSDNACSLLTCWIVFEPAISTQALGLAEMLSLLTRTRQHSWRLASWLQTGRTPARCRHFDGADYPCTQTALAASCST